MTVVACFFVIERTEQIIKSKKRNRDNVEISIINKIQNKL